MDDQLIQSLPLLATGALAPVLIVLTLPRRYAPGAKPFLIMEIGAVVWSFAYAFSFLDNQLTDKIFWNKVSYSGHAILPGAWLAFALQYSGKDRWLSPRYIALLAVDPVIRITLAWTNDAHGLVWGPAQLDTTGAVVVLSQTFGPVFLMGLAYTSALIIIGVWVYIQEFLHSQQIYLGQAIAVLTAVLFPGAVYLAFQLGLRPLSYDPTAFATAVGNSALLWGFFGTRFFDVVPVARDLIIEDMSEGVIVLDPQDNVIDMNRSAGLMIGQAPRNVIGQQATEALAVLAPHLEITLSGQDTPSEVRLDIHGSERWYELRVLPIPIRSARGLGHLIMMHDTTQRRHAEDRIRESLAEKETLLQEINHRVKNNLQIVSSLLSLQSRDIKDEKALRAFQVSQDRIRAMALVHEKLYLSDDLARIDFGEYIKSLADDLESSYGLGLRDLKLKIDVDKILLGVDTAIPCGVIVNELVANSLKHAFPGDRSGEIAISFRRVDGQYTMVFKDDGVGLPEELDISRPSSLGLTIVNALTGQLGGTIGLVRNGGSEINITFPAK